MILKVLKSRATLIVVGVVVVALLGGGVYIKYLKDKLTAYVNAVDALAVSVETTEKENVKLRKDVEDLDKLLKERTDKYLEEREHLNELSETREELKNDNKEVRKYYNTGVPEPVLNRMQQW